MFKSLELMKKRVGYLGDSVGDSQWDRMRVQKLRSLKSALYASYQAAIVQPYDATNDTMILNITSIITAIQDDTKFSDNQLNIMSSLEKQYEELAGSVKQHGRRSSEYIQQLKNIISDKSGSYFRAIINHQRNKVEYQDKQISIPFEQNTVTIDPVKDNKDNVETNIKVGTVLKWVHGNKEEWTPDSYWIVLLQYSQQTAYFRGEIRKADSQIEITVIADDGTQTTKIYRGYINQPNDNEINWNLKHNVVWNDMDKIKILYLTKDEDTDTFFKRFKRVIIDGKPYQVQTVNDNYGATSANGSTGLMRVAIKETYTTTENVIKQQNQKKQTQEPMIVGPGALTTFDKNVTYKVLNPEENTQWSVQTVQAGATTDDYIKYYVDDSNNLIISNVISTHCKKGIKISYGSSVKVIKIVTS